MKLAVFNKLKSIIIEEIPMPKIRTGEILVKVEACAICTWEQRVYSGVKEVPFPFVGGHEISGEIVKVGEGINHKIWSLGDKVIYGTNLACGDCNQCKSGNEQNCEDFDHEKPIGDTGFIGMGGFSEYIIAKPQHLFKYENLNPIDASLTEPLSCCIHSVESADIQYGETVMVIGCGIMGQLHVQLSLLKGAKVIAVDMNQNRLDRASENGAHITINNGLENLEERIEATTKGKGVDVIFNTTAISKVAETVQPYLSINGRHILYSSFYPDNPVTISPDTLHKKATKIIGTANSNPRDFMKAIKLLEAGIIDLSQYVDEVYALEDIEEALESAILADKYRVVVSMNN